MSPISTHLRAYSAVKSDLDSTALQLEQLLARFGPVIRRKGTGASGVLDALLPLASFGSRYVLVAHLEWTALLHNGRTVAAQDLVGCAVQSSRLPRGVRVLGRFEPVLHRSPRRCRCAQPCVLPGGRSVGVLRDGLTTSLRRSCRLPKAPEAGQAAAVFDLQFPQRGDWCGFAPRLEGLAFRRVHRPRTLNVRPTGSGRGVHGRDRYLRKGRTWNDCDWLVPWCPKT